MELEIVTHCPICSGSKHSHFLRCIDYTVSKETFDIVECDTCKFKFTNPRPNEQIIGQYYQSNEYISHSNTNKGIVNKIYQTVRKQTLQKKLQLINNLSNKRGALLDIGCGTGAFLKVCKEGGWLTKGIETDENARKMAIELSSSDVESDLLTYTIQHQFDVITMWHVLEHIHQLDKSIEKIKTLLHSNGHLCVAVPNSNSYDASKFKEYWAAYDVPRHLYHFSQDSIKKLFAKNDMQVIRIIPMKYDAYYISMLSSKYRSGKINYAEAVWTGLKSNQWAAENKNDYSSLIYIIKKNP